MSHPFGDLISQHLSRKHGLSQNKLAMGIDQDPAVISGMCHGRRLHGSLARERVLAIIDWLEGQGVLNSEIEANRLLEAAKMSSLSTDEPVEKELLNQLISIQPSPTIQAINSSEQAMAVLHSPRAISVQAKKTRLFLLRPRIWKGVLVVMLILFGAFFAFKSEPEQIWQANFRNASPQWQEISAFWTLAEGNSAILHENDLNEYFGKVESELITIEAASMPILYLDVRAIDLNASYSIQIQDAKTYESTDVLKDVTIHGEHSINLVEAMGWQADEKYTITINIWISGEGKSVTFNQLAIKAR